MSRAFLRDLKKCETNSIPRSDVMSDYSTCGSGPLLRMAGYSSPQVGYKLLRQSTSALVGTLDPYPQVFQIQDAIPGSVWVSATG